mgnify:CR=1 FL=1
MYKLAIIPGAFDGEIQVFDTELERTAFSKGFALASGIFSPETCHTVTEEDANDDLSDYQAKLAEEPLNEFYNNKVEQLKEIIEAFTKNDQEV